MKCQDCQRDLLNAEELETLPAEAEAHMAQCAICRDFQQQLVQIEKNVPLLPIPVSRAKEQLLQRILQIPGANSHPVAAPTLHMKAPPVPAPVSRSGRSPWRRLALSAGGLAAAITLVVGGIWLGQLLSGALNSDHGSQQARDDKKPDPPNPFAKKPPPARPENLVDRLLECDLRLAEANTPRERVETLADLADALSGEAKALTQATAAKELTILAQFYGKVVQDGVVNRSRSLPMTERQDILAPIVKKLERTREEADDLARKAPGSAEPLRRIAAAAQAGQQHLRELMQEGTE